MASRICTVCSDIDCTVHVRRRLTRQETARRKAVVDAWRSSRGDICPGWNTDTHVVRPPNILTADHVDPLANGGAEGGVIVVLCRSCNSSRQNLRTPEGA